MTFKVGVIGAGFGRRVVAPAFSALAGAEVVEVVSARDDDGVAQLCSRSDLDLVCVHSPPSFHARHVRLALDKSHPRAVLCDKPLGLDPEESTQMLEAAKESGTLHFVNFEFRYLDARQELQSIMSSGEIGEPVELVWSHFSTGTAQPLRPFGWLFDRAQGGGWVGAWASHAVDTVRWLLGEVRHTDAVQGTLIGQRPDSAGASRPRGSRGLTVRPPRHGERRSGGTHELLRFAGIGGSQNPGDRHRRGRRVHRRPRGDGDRRRRIRPPVARAPEGERHMRAMVAWARVIRDATDAGRQEAPSFADGVACDRVLQHMRAGPWLRWGERPPSGPGEAGLPASVSSGGGQGQGVAIVGAALSDCGRVDDKDEFELHYQAASRAIADAGLEKSDIDGYMSCGTGFHAPVEVCEYLGLRPNWVDGTQLGGSSWEFFVNHARGAIASGQAEVVVMSYGSTTRANLKKGRRTANLPFSARGPSQFGAPWGHTLISKYAIVARRHMYEFGTTIEQLAEIAVSARYNASLNPEAYYRDPITIEDVQAAAMVADPFTKLHCCIRSDGGGAIVVTSAERAMDCAKKPVLVLGAGEATSHVAMSEWRDFTESPCVRSAGPPSPRPA